MSYNLFLDDIRIPADVEKYFNPIQYRELFRKFDWIIVRNYDEFVRTIKTKGVPNTVSFDHDLADEHYAPKEIWEFPEQVEKRIDNFKEKTGYDCALFLLDYCRGSGDLGPKLVLCHSMNPVGKKKILELFEYHKNDR